MLCRRYMDAIQVHRTAAKVERKCPKWPKRAQTCDRKVSPFEEIANRCRYKSEKSFVTTIFTQE